MDDWIHNIGPLAAMSAGMDIFAALVALLLLVSCIVMSGHRDHVTRYYMAIVGVQLVLLSCDAAWWLFNGAPGFGLFVSVLLFMIDLLGYVALTLFSCFIIEYVRQFTAVPAWVKRTVVAVGVGVSVLWSIVTVCTGLTYSVDESGKFVAGLFYDVGAAAGVWMILFNLIFVLRHRKLLEPHTTVILMLYGILPLAGFALQPVWDTTPVYLGSTMASVMCYAVVHVEQTRLIARQERELAESRVSIAVSQIQPHFLFNALNTICYLCGTDAKEAQRALREFSSYLRMNIDSIGVNVPVFFQAELDHLSTYLKLEKMRFEDELMVEYDVQTTGFKVPPLSVQPLVENAVKHGVGKKPGGGTVALRTRELDDCFEIVVADDGVGFDPSVTPDDGREHMGIKNVRQRLWTMCAATLDVQSAPGEGTTITIHIPKEGGRA